MKALYFDGQLKMTEIPVPEPEEGEVLIRILYSAICQTDLEILKGYRNFRGVPGHEFSGEVVTPGHPLTGKNVVGEINIACHRCYLCAQGKKQHCLNRRVAGIDGHQGTFAEYICLPAENLHLIPSSLDPAISVFTEPLAAALEVFEQLGESLSGNIFIFGAGKLGLLVSMISRLRGLDYTVYDIHDEKVGFAHSIGINCLNINTLDKDVKAGICIDCSGSPDGIQEAISHLYPRGTLVLKTTVAGAGFTDLNSIVINEFTIIGSRCGPFKASLDLLAGGKIDPAPLITARFSFKDIFTAFDAAGKTRACKVIIEHGI